MVWEMLSEDQMQAGNYEIDSLPGEKLRAARVLKKLSIESVAASLHLASNLIEALEMDDYGKFPAPIFVSGYLRNYAKLVGIDPAPLLAAYERSGAQVPPILTELTSKIVRRRRRFGVNGWLGYVTVLMAIMLIMVWWLSDPVIEPTEVFEGFDEKRDEQVLIMPSTPSQDFMVDEQEDDKQDQFVQDESESMVQQELLVPVEEPVEVVQDTLVLHFTGESWVEISDVTGRRIFYNMGHPGQTETLRGSAPFDILLGYSPGVTIEFNGKKYDHSAYVRNNVARFRLQD